MGEEREGRKERCWFPHPWDSPEHLPASSGLGILMSIFSPQLGKVQSLSSVEASGTMILNLWVCISDTHPHPGSGIYIMIHHSSKNTFMKYQQNDFVVGGHDIMRDCVKGSRH